MMFSQSHSTSLDPPGMPPIPMAPMTLCHSEFGGMQTAACALITVAPINSSNDVGDCCPRDMGYNNCVLLGTSQAMLTEFPREAMLYQQPYPFGIDPVCDVDHLTCHIVCDRLHHLSHDLSDRSHDLSSDMAGGGEQAAVHQLLQDEDGCHPGNRADALWGHSWCLQSRVSMGTSSAAGSGWTYSKPYANLTLISLLSLSLSSPPPMHALTAGTLSSISTSLWSLSHK